MKYGPFNAANAVVAISDSGLGGGGAAQAARLEPDTALIVVVAWLIAALFVTALFTERAEISGATAAPENTKEMLQSNPLRRMGDPEHDIGGVALFLASEDSDYVTGNTIFASGGTQVNGVRRYPRCRTSGVGVIDFTGKVAWVSGAARKRG